MSDEDRKETGGFGPLFSRFYSVFIARTKRSRELYSYITDAIEEYHAHSILDVGCGPGVLLEKIAGRFPDSEVYGVDPSPSMVSVAKKRFKKYMWDKRVFITTGNSLDIPFDGKFDLIVSSMSFHHWQFRNEGIEYLKGKLSDVGVLVIFERLGDDGPAAKGMQHSLSRSEAEKFSPHGMKRRIRVDGDIISVEFTLTDPT